MAKSQSLMPDNVRVPQTVPVGRALIAMGTQDFLYGADGGGEKGKWRRETVPAGSFKPNPLGCSAFVEPALTERDSAMTFTPALL